jgi:hypothetical protein
MTRKQYLNIAVVILFAGFVLLFLSLRFNNGILAYIGLAPLLVGMIILLAKVIPQYDIIKIIRSRSKKK